MALPQELIDYIISFIEGDELGSDDTECRKWLSVCAQTSRSFRTPAQQKLFSNFIVDCTRMESWDSSATMARLISILASNNDLLRLVLSIEFKLVAYPRDLLLTSQAKLDELLQILKQCPNLKRVAITGVDDVGIWIAPEGLQNALSNLILSLSVTRLDLTMVTFCPSWKVTSHLAELNLDRAAYAPHRRSPSAENLPPPIPRLSIRQTYGPSHIRGEHVKIRLENGILLQDSCNAYQFGDTLRVLEITLCSDLAYVFRQLGGLRECHNLKTLIVQVYIPLNPARKRGILDFLLPDSGSNITDLFIRLPVARRGVDRFTVDLFHLNSDWHVLHVANLLPNHPNLKKYRICVDLTDLRILTAQPEWNVDNIKQEVRSRFSFVKPADVAERFAAVEVDIEVVPPTLFL